MFRDSFLAPFTDNLGHSLTQIKASVHQIFASLEILKVEVGGLKSSNRGDQLKIAGSFIKLDEYFRHSNSSFLQLNDQFNSLSFNLTTTLSPLSPALKNLEQKVEHLRALDK